MTITIEKEINTTKGIINLEISLSKILNGSCKTKNQLYITDRQSHRADVHQDPA